MTGSAASRIAAVMIKEFKQLTRDRLTYALMLGLPVIQLLLFGYAINTEPRHLPTAVLVQEDTVLARSIVSALHHSAYFDLAAQARSPAELDEMIRQGRVQFAVTIPENFGRKLVRGERPVLLVEADASDPSAIGNAVAALSQLSFTALQRDLTGTLSELKASASPVDLRVHRRYNPEGITAYNIVPGLIGTILTMTMVLMTGLAMTRERERGTFENLLSTPALPIEVMTGKIVPYILIGLIQVTLIIVCALFLFQVPMQGSYLVLYFVVSLFIAANLTLGITFSSVARNQLQAMQMTFFFFLPSILLSGFMFPFRGMPEWAQVLGSLLPLTHFVRLVRGIMLKGNELAELWPDVWPLFAFMLVVILIGLRFYKRTLD